MINTDTLPERRTRQYLQSFLISQGWSLVLERSTNRGIDIEAKRNWERWVIRAMVWQPSPKMIAIAFASTLGETLQRMQYPTCKYSVALPDTEPFRRLWHRLPPAAKNRTGMTALFVGPTGNVTEEE